MKAHTPGPWETSVIEKNGVILWDVCETGGGDMIADLSECGPNNTAANAYLIAAAPELLTACKTALEYLKPLYPVEHLVIERLISAVEKAERG